MNDLKNSLGILKLLTEALTLPTSLDEGLNHITRMTCELMETSQATFLLRDEERQDFILRSAVGIDVPVGNVLQLPERLKRILWSMKNQHQINWIIPGFEAISFPVIVTPVIVKGFRIGLLTAGGAKNVTSSRPFDTIHQSLFALIAPFASLVFENAKMNDLLCQRFAIHPQTMTDGPQEPQDSARQLMVTAISNPNKVIRMLSQSFYKELVRAGFRGEHIATAAAQLLECIVQEGSQPCS